MLLWQQNDSDLGVETYYSQARPDLQRKALIFSLLFYFFLCLPLFIGVPQSKEAVTVVVRGNPHPVVFLPSKNRKKGRQSGALSTAQKYKSAGMIAKSDGKHAHVSDSIVNKKAVQKNTKKGTPHKAKQKNALIKDKSSVEKKKMSQKKVMSDKKNLPSLEKANAQKKSELVQAKKDPVVQSVKKQEQLVEKKGEPQVSTIAEQKQPFAAQDELTVINHVLSDEWDGEDSVSKAHRALSYGISRVWKAPRIAVKKPLHMCVELTSEGKVCEARIEKSSDVPAYDIAARAAVLRAQYPREFWGKTVVLVFGGEEL